MYCTVPRMVPCAVPGAEVANRVIPDIEIGPAGALSFASPKSRSFAPALVSMMLAGFRSRWTIPCRWALSSASAISAAIFSAWSSGSAPFSSRAASVCPSRCGMTRKCVPFALADVVDAADVRMVEGRDGARLALEARPQLGIVSNLTRRILIATVRSSRVSRAL